MIKRILNSKTKSITFAAFLLAVSSFISQFLGLIRDRLLAGRFGAGSELDIYFAAFRIPDFVYGILIVGGITGAFLPVFASYFKNDDGEDDWSKEAIEFANNVLNCFFALLVVVCGVLAIFAPWVVKFIIPGFSAENRELTISLTRIMFLSPILFGLSSIFSGIAQFFHKFFSYAIAPILYNTGIIIGIMFFVPIFGLYGLAYGVILGAVMYFLIQLPAAYASGFKYRPILNLKNKGLKKIFSLMIPRTFSSAVYYINLIFVTAIASTFIPGSITVFTFSDNIQSFPTMIIGLSFAISCFPTLSKYWANKEKGKFLESFSSTFRQITFLVIPASVLMFLLRIQIIRLLLGTGDFGWWETRLTAGVLGLFCFSVFANSLVPLIIRAFFSFHDTKTPMIISVFSIITNVIFSFVFVHLLGFENAFRVFFVDFLRLQGVDNITILALPLALGFSAFFQMVLLLIWLYKKIGDFRTKEILDSTLKVAVASIVMGFVVYGLRQYSASFVDMASFAGILSQTAIASLAGAIVYFVIAYLLKASEVKTIIQSFLKQFV